MKKWVLSLLIALILVVVVYSLASFNQPILTGKILQEDVIQIYRCKNGAGFRMETKNPGAECTGSIESGGNGYVEEKSLGYLLIGIRPLTHSLYKCYLPNEKKYETRTQRDCGNYDTEYLLGYAYNDKGENTHAVWNCRNYNLNIYMLSKTPVLGDVNKNCEEEGWESESIMGYFITMPLGSEKSEIEEEIGVEETFEEEIEEEASEIVVEEQIEKEEKSQETKNSMIIIYLLVLIIVVFFVIISYMKRQSGNISQHK